VNAPKSKRLPSPAATLQILAADDEYCIALWGNLLASAWSGTPTPSRVLRLRESINEASRKNPDGIIVVLRLGALLPIPEGEARAIVVETMRRFDKDLLSWVIVMEGEGFRAAAARTVASTVRLLARGSFPMPITGDVREAASLIAARMPTATAGEVKRVLDQVQSELKTS
jgi:hypothetical protein